MLAGTHRHHGFTATRQCTCRCAGMSAACHSVLCNLATWVKVVRNFDWSGAVLVVILTCLRQAVANGCTLASGGTTGVAATLCPIWPSTERPSSPASFRAILVGWRPFISAIGCVFVMGGIVHRALHCYAMHVCCTLAVAGVACLEFHSCSPANGLEVSSAITSSAFVLSLTVRATAPLTA